MPGLPCCQRDDHLISRQRVCAPLPAFGGPGLPLAALSDTDEVLAPHTRERLLLRFGHHILHLFRCEGTQRLARDVARLGDVEQA